jgi:ABC-type nickel/cobalt efflux system permease component RcnA
LAVLAALFTLSIAGAAAAHPLGNFTVSRYSALTFREKSIDVLYIVDMAEIPTFQERQAMDKDSDGRVDPAEEVAWAERQSVDIAGNLLLTIDGSAIPLAPVGHILTFPPGQGELLTTRLEVRLTADLPEPEADHPLAFLYEDRNFRDRLGWQEIVATAEDGRLLESTVPADDISDQLRAYPADLLQTPQSVSHAEIRYAPAAADLARGTVQSAPVETAAVPARRFDQDEFAGLLSRSLDTPGAWLLALLVAAGLGAAHALTPGHGKTIVGAYLVGSRGTARHALILGLTTTITHTAGVFALGLVVLVASEFVMPEKFYPWLGVLSGLLVVLIGLSILRGHFRHWLAYRHDMAHERGHYHFHFGKSHVHGSHGSVHLRPAQSAHQPARTTTKPARVLAFATVAQANAKHETLLPAGRHHDLGDAHSDKGHHHPHTHNHEHPTATDDDSLSLRRLLALGISGGLLPCPSALILMLSAIALRQVGAGLVLILAFSIGLASVLTGIGLVMVYAGKLLERLPLHHSGLTTRLLPMASSLFITAAGLLITVRALQEAGVL